MRQGIVTLSLSQHSNQSWDNYVIEIATGFKFATSEDETVYVAPGLSRELARKG